jgi:branched-subunit amino acid ABC-type transport system permease component
MTLGGFLGYIMIEQAEGGFPAGFLAAFIGVGIVSVLTYRLIFQNLGKHGASIIHLMIASIGLGYVIRHTIGEVWGWSPLSYTVTWSAFDVGRLRVTGLWLGLIATAIVLSIVLHLLLTRTKIGKAIRAISTNPELALVSGINAEKVILFAWFVGAGLAGIAGIFRGADARLSPMMGWDILLPVFATTILGGIGNFYGLVLAAFILGAAENFGVVVLDALGLSTEYRMAIAFLVLIVVLVVRPRGLARA